MSSIRSCLDQQISLISRGAPVLNLISAFSAAHMLTRSITHGCRVWEDALVPLVQVAWADGRVDEREQEAVLQAAAEQGIDPGHPAYELLQNWLNEAPGPELFDKWQIYVQGLAQTLDAEAIRQLRADIMERAREVAECTGKLLGIGSGVSAAELRELKRLDLVFRLTH